MKLKPGVAVDEAAFEGRIVAAYRDVGMRVMFADQDIDQSVQSPPVESNAHTAVAEHHPGGNRNHYTTELYLSIHYFGQTTWNLDSGAVGRLVDIARPLTRAIHDSCAPSSQAAPGCRVEGMGRSRPCAPTI